MNYNKNIVPRYFLQSFIRNYKCFKDLVITLVITVGQYLQDNYSNNY